MNLGLSGKVALITGASKGIGRAIAIALTAEGCRVAITARGKDDLAKVVAEIEANGGVALALPGDVTKDEDCKAMVAKTVAHFGGLHVLVNNAGGIGSFASFDKTTDQDWIDLWNLNIVSVVRITQAALPHMQRQKWGRIVNIASESGIQPDAEMPHYNATKAALINLTKSLSKAYGGDGILVNAVSPAFIMTPLVEEMLHKQAQAEGVSDAEAEAHFLRQNRPNIVLKRAGTPEETASLVAFLASEAASFVTGANYRVDGGSVATI